MAVDLNNSDLNALMEALKRQGFSAAQAGYIAGIDPGQRQQAYDTYVNEMIPQVSAVDLANIENARNMATLQRSQGLANVDFQQGNAQQNYGISRDNLVRQFDQMRQSLPYQYNSRGLMNSGVYQQGLQNYADSRLRGLNQFDTQHQQNMAGFGLQKQQVEGSFKTAMDNAARAEAARRQATAAQIKAIQ